MNIRELHIRIQTQLQLMGAYVYGQIREPELDMIIHEALIKIIKKYYNKYKSENRSGYSSNGENLMAIQGFHKEVTLPAYVLTNTISYLELPFDYMLPVREEVLLKYNCNGINAANQANTYKIARFDISDYTVPSPLSYFYDNFKIKFDGTVVFDFNLYRNFQKELESSDAKFYLVNLILEELNKRQDCKVYWEYFQGEYFPNQIIVTTFNNYTNLSTEYHDPLLNMTASFLQGNRLIKVVNEEIPEINNSDVRLVSSEEIVKKRQNPYERTNFKSPLAEIYNNRLMIDYDKTFVINEVKLVYIKRPIVPNYYLNNNIETDNNMFITELIAEALMICKQTLKLNS